MSFVSSIMVHCAGGRGSLHMTSGRPWPATRRTWLRPVKVPNKSQTARLSSLCYLEYEHHSLGPSRVAPQGNPGQSSTSVTNSYRYEILHIIPPPPTRSLCINNDRNVIKIRPLLDRFRTASVFDLEPGLMFRSLCDMGYHYCVHR